MFLFAIQIYSDFSGYSDIAIGTARLFGFGLTRNFACPYFSRDIAEFWRRWHISLSSWFRDYVYIPLGGGRTAPLRRTFNVLVTFTVSGLWHGADWTFILWGFFNGLYFVPLMLSGRNKENKNLVAEAGFLPSLRETMQMSATFALTLFAWVFFRSESVSDAFEFVARTFSGRWLVFPRGELLVAVTFSLALLAVEWVQRGKQHALDVGRLPVGLRWSLYLVIVLVVLLLGHFGEVEFIYFQF